MSTTTDRPGKAPPSTSGASGDGGEASGGPLSAASSAASEAYRSARERTSAAYSAARERAGAVGQRTAESLDAAPMAAVIGGLALGAIAGALLPRTRREEELLGSVGRRINDGARDAVRAARDAGREQLDGFTDRAVSALRSSAGAAADSVRKR
ncbi:MAG: hypothetical protein QOK17_1194 [Sphingomonadales bacterium]|jgi:ElaB/YqjD/DUF883 family membrane-anchored ribosome-binding protein|nr:hypothetical protein [Sphingomonadales bacterium]